MNAQMVRQQLQKKKEELDKKFIGLTINEATQLWNGEVLIIENNGVAFAQTIDYRFDRLNLFIKNDLVYKVNIG